MLPKQQVVHVYYNCHLLAVASMTVRKDGAYISLDEQLNAIFISYLERAGMNRHISIEIGDDWCAKIVKITHRSRESLQNPWFWSPSFAFTSISDEMKTI